jgi:Na+/H+-dicarboxylate symporter
MFKKMPFALLALIILIGWLQPWIPLAVQSAFYGLSLSIKSVIIFLLPFVIFGLLFKTVSHLAQKSTTMIFVILIAICGSNFLSTILSYGVAKICYRFDLAISFPHEEGLLQPLWNYQLPQLIGNNYAMLLAVALGLLLGLYRPSFAHTISFWAQRVVDKILRLFLYFIPLFIMGFVMKMFHDQVMGYVLKNYGQIFAMIVLSLTLYNSLLYFIAARWNRVPFSLALKTMIPAAIAGFSSMSSAVAMPLTLLGVKKNAKNGEIAQSIIPATVNVHLIGDCFAIPIFAFAILKSFGCLEPSGTSYLIFALYFILAKFSVAAVPGGGILVMLPLLESYLGFNGAMLSLITALYILFDPIITCANIFGNGAFAMIVSRFFNQVKQ